MTTDKDLPLHRVIPVKLDQQELRDAFHKAVDSPQDKHFGLPAKQAKANQKRALDIMRQVRAKKRS